MQPATEAPEPSPRDRHLFGPGRKRILALDGGGVRGAITIAFIEALEAAVARVEGHPVRLCDWFDLIGGTSTGAIIATALALGYSAADIRAFYERLAPRVFAKRFYRVIGWQAKFDARRLREELDAVIGSRKLDSLDLQTGLCLMLKRMDTGSAWMVMNNPRSVFWNTPADGAFIGNRHMPLANLVRASTAAPHYFDPELISIIEGEPPGLFVDGGLTPHNNPSIALLLAVALPAHGLNWKLGPDNLTIVSIGTGSFRPRLSYEQAKRARAIGLAIASLAAQINDNQQLTLTLMSWLGETPHSWPIDSEIGDLGPVNPPFGALFRFLRYDVMLEAAWLAKRLDHAVTPFELARLHRMDEPKNIPALYTIGRKAAALQVQDSDLV